MTRPPHPRVRAEILHRLSQLEVELRSVRLQLKDLDRRDPQMPQVVLRGAQLSREKAGLELRLEVLRMDPRYQVAP